ncbi:hypothetical protein ACFQU2_31800 [Siccirubricoccus deserti]
MIGVKPLFADLAIDADAEAAFEVIALDPEARPIAAPLRARLVRERPDWRIVTRGSQARYETVWRDEAVDSAELQPTVGALARFARRLGFGRYRLEVSDPPALPSPPSASAPAGPGRDAGGAGQGGRRRRPPRLCAGRDGPPPHHPTLLRPGQHCRADRPAGLDPRHRGGRGRH